MWFNVPINTLPIGHFRVEMTVLNVGTNLHMVVGWRFFGDVDDRRPEKVL